MSSQEVIPTIRPTLTLNLTWILNLILTLTLTLALSLALAPKCNPCLFLWGLGLGLTMIRLGLTMWLGGLS